MTNDPSEKEQNTAVDESLVRRISRQVYHCSGHRLSDSQASTLIERFSKKHVADVDKRWWWASLKSEGNICKYSDNGGLELIANLLRKHSQIFLVVTDDEFPPWPVFQVATSDVLEILDDNRFFEFMVADLELEHYIFDTHDNCLVTNFSI